MHIVKTLCRILLAWTVIQCEQSITFIIDHLDCFFSPQLQAELADSFIPFWRRIRNLQELVDCQLSQIKYLTGASAMTCNRIYLFIIYLTGWSEFKFHFFTFHNLAQNSHLAQDVSMNNCLVWRALTFLDAVSILNEAYLLEKCTLSTFSRSYARIILGLKNISGDEEKKGKCI